MPELLDTIRKQHFKKAYASTPPYHPLGLSLEWSEWSRKSEYKNTLFSNLTMQRHLRTTVLFFFFFFLNMHYYIYTYKLLLQVHKIHFLPYINYGWYKDCLGTITTMKQDTSFFSILIIRTKIQNFYNITCWFTSRCLARPSMYSGLRWYSPNMAKLETWKHSINRTRW